MFLCSFYMLFRKSFWKMVFKIQFKRVSSIAASSEGICKHCIIILPLYIIICFFEIVICIVYYAIPLCGFFVIIVRGAIKTIAVTIHSSRQTFERKFISILLKNRLVISSFSMFVALSFTFYVYSFCLVFIQSFLFVSQILIYCYVAVIVYPTISFGYLFFAVVLLYYIFRLIRGFGVKYLELLNDIVEIVTRTEEQENYFTVFEGNLVLSNVKASGLKSITINGAKLPVTQNALQRIQCGERKTLILRFNNNTYGIPKKLFDYAVEKHLPVHQQTLRVVFQLGLILLFLLVTITLTREFLTGPTSAISDVMHVIFIITVGALPRVLEVALIDSSAHIHRDIKIRHLEDTICEYFKGLSDSPNDSALQSTSSHTELLNMANS